MEFIHTTLGEISLGGKGSYGIAASAVEKSSELYTYLRITDIKDDGTLNLDGLMSVNDPKAEQYLLSPNDIVFARTGASTGRNYFHDGKEGEFVYAGFLIRFSIDPQKVNPKFVKYYCLSKTYRNWVHSYNAGSTRGNINAQTFAQMPISLPPRKYQDRAVSILDDITEKIKNNELINKNLEQQAQALFKAWFVDFEAFSGEKPNGWISAKLGNIAEISTSSFSPAKNPDAVVEHYSIPAFDEKKYPVFEVADDIKSNKYILSPNSVMISKLNPDTKRVWRPYCISPLAISSTEFIVFEAKNLAYRDFVYSIIDSDAFSNHMCAHTSGSTNSRQRTMPKTTLDFEFILPTEDVILDFCEIVTPMYNLIQANVIENQHLAEARDILLPKLMSGELDITEIDI